MRFALLIAAAVALGLAACGDADETANPAAAEVAALPEPEMPADAPPQEEVDLGMTAPGVETGACDSQVGAAAAARLVERCIAVSPATHPPCNVANPCELIQGEIERSCAMYGPGEDKPNECTA